MHHVLNLSVVAIAWALLPLKVQDKVDIGIIGLIVYLTVYLLWDNHKR